MNRNVLELVCQQFAKDRTACKRMAEFAHIVDFRLPGIHDLPPLAEIITYYRSMPDACTVNFNN